MSRSVDLFIDTPLALDQMAAKLGELCGHRLDQASGVDGPWVLDEGPLRATLGEHPFVDDADLLLSRYRFALSARIADGAGLQGAPETGLLRRLAEGLHDEPETRTLLVLDLQYRDDDAVEPAAAGQATE